jgi:hypothetical protein
MLLVADFESAAPPESTAPQVGLDSLQLPRFLLDTCENVDQAKQALLGAKQYDHGLPLHYLIADAGGQAFVWERGRDGSEHMVQAGGGPLCVTNHLLHRHPDPMNLPEDTADSLGSYGRLRTLHERGKGATLSREDLCDSLRAVGQAEDSDLPFRTLWSTVFDTADRTLSTRFWLGEGRGYSEELVFRTSAR